VGARARRRQWRWRWLRRYGLGVALGLLFAGAWAGQWWVQVVLEGETALAFWASTLENWQSEWLQLLTFVVLTRWLYFAGSHESKDPPE
jgi:hypothetical protein